MFFLFLRPISLVADFSEVVVLPQPASVSLAAAETTASRRADTCGVFQPADAIFHHQ